MQFNRKCMKLTKFGILVIKTTSLSTSIRDGNISRGCVKSLIISEGRGGGKFWGPILENPEWRGVIWQNPLCGGGMDIFWNHTFLQIHMFRLIDRSLCLTYRTHAMNYFASLGIFMCHGCRMQR